MSESPVIEGVFVKRPRSFPIVTSQAISYPNVTFRTDNNYWMSLVVTSKITSDRINDLILRKARCRVRTHLDKEGRSRVISITELDAAEEPTYFNPSKFLQALRDMP